jgi:catalase
MADLTTHLINGLGKGFPNHVDGTRPIHTVGTAAIGWFRGTEVAPRYCIAPQFGRHWTPVTVRFSNGNGQPDPDRTQQVRGMAVKFHLGVTSFDAHGVIQGDPDTDLVMTSVPMFVANTPEKVLEFEQAYIPRKFRRYTIIDRVMAMAKLEQLPAQDPRAKTSSVEGSIEFSKKYRPSQAFVVANSMQQPPASYLRTAYHAVHAFDLEGNDGVHRFGRFTFEPADGLRANHAPNPPDDYLRAELVRRLELGPCRFNLRLTLADPGDDPNDSTVVWPMNRRRVLMGTLRLDYPVPSQQLGCEQLSFNPGRLVKGMGLSDDPVLHARVAVYNQSQRNRPGAYQCPVATPPSPATDRVSQK